jgi:hypothetical protein
MNQQLGFHIIKIPILKCTMLPKVIAEREIPEILPDMLRMRFCA